MSAAEAIGCDGVWKTFGETVANADVSLSVARGEVHAIIGENGAGKSTLMRALVGLSPPERGQVRLKGEVVTRPSVEEAFRRGIGMVHQHFMLVPTLTVLENVVLGREPVKHGALDLARVATELSALGEKFQLAIDPSARVSSLSVGELQRVEIVKVLWRGADVLVLDEPTAVLTPLEVERLFAILRELVRAGTTVIIVTHKLDEVMALADRVTVLRRGRVVASLARKDTSAKALARVMVGDETNLELTRKPRQIGEARLSVEALTVGKLSGVSFAVKRGEIVGVAGVEGNGQQELMLALAGLEPIVSGRVFVDGKDLTQASVAARRLGGIAHVPADRHLHGLAVDLSVAENVRLGGEALSPEKIIAELDVRPTDPAARAGDLSGGNQQKVVIGRELAHPLSVLLCAQPTRGVDIGAAAKLHGEILRAAESGTAVFLISAELDELLLLCDRVLVLYKGKIVGERVVDLAAREAQRSEIGALMLGATKEGGA